MKLRVRQGAPERFIERLDQLDGNISLVEMSTSSLSDRYWTEIVKLCLIRSHVHARKCVLTACFWQVTVGGAVQSFAWRSLFVPRHLWFFRTLSPVTVPRIENTSDLLKVSLAALGVVYGDIGTSPLYAFKECFIRRARRPVDTANVFGILSLFFWSLTLVVVFKYMTYIMRADNNGEGGILSLLAVLGATRQRRPSRGRSAVAGAARAVWGSAALRRRHHHAGDLGVFGGGRRQVYAPHDWPRSLCRIDRDPGDHR
jgi:hypothetical protein